MRMMNAPANHARAVDAPITRVFASDRQGRRVTDERIVRAYSPYLGLALGILVALPCAFIAAAAGGAGHGTYLPARLFFPFTMLSTLICGPVTAPFIAVALLQFPFHGVVLGFCHRASRLRHGLLSVVAVHLVAVTLSLVLPSTSFPNRVGRANNDTSADGAGPLRFTFVAQGRATAEFVRWQHAYGPRDGPSRIQEAGRGGVEAQTHSSL